MSSTKQKKIEKKSNCASLNQKPLSKRTSYVVLQTARLPSFGPSSVDRRRDRRSGQDRGAEAAPPARLSINCKFQFIFGSFLRNPPASAMALHRPCPIASDRDSTVP